MSSDDTWSMTDRPFTYIIVPLIGITVLFCAATIVFRRRRRRRRAQIEGDVHWPQDHADAHPGRVSRPRTWAGHRSGRNRRTPREETRVPEGLNELGEAPPPYDGKREAGLELQGTEMRDLEAGMGQPPGYLSEPRPVVTRDTR